MCGALSLREASVFIDWSNRIPGMRPFINYKQFMRNIFDLNHDLNPFHSSMPLVLYHCKCETAGGANL